MKENEIFKIQGEQVNKAIDGIEWIVANYGELIRDLRAKIAEENTAYLTDDSSPFVAKIFRGQYIRQWIDSYVALGIAKEKSDR